MLLVTGPYAALSACLMFTKIGAQVLDKTALIRSNMAAQVKREIEIMTRVRHPYVVDLLEVFATNDKIYMVMELVPGGELFDRIVADGPLPVSIPMPADVPPPVSNLHICKGERWHLCNYARVTTPISTTVKASGLLAGGQDQKAVPAADGWPGLLSPPWRLPQVCSLFSDVVHTALAHKSPCAEPPAHTCRCTVVYNGFLSTDVPSLSR